jgi:hypothetical protein
MVNTSDDTTLIEHEESATYAQIFV